MNRWSRLAFVLLIAAALATPSAFASSLSVAFPRASGSASVVEERFAGFWSFLTRLWAKNGCEVDPNGRCLPASPQAADNGCSADPNGRCLPRLSQEAGDNGCSADPSGRCGK
ncbi:MAG: hypothetical protein ACREMY_00045 [bacterium]